jgi:4-hydroxy-2-oxoglutarate aldolase
MTRQQTISNLKGVIAPLTTPFNRRGDLDDGAFRANLRRWSGIGMQGHLLTGSTGEAPYLTERERLRLVDLARPLIRPPEVLLVGTGLEGTRETIRLSREVIARGADAILVVTPNYYKPAMKPDSLIAHYRAIADAVSRPVIVYSIPQFTGVRVGADTLAPLSRHANVVGVKESSGDLGFVKSVVKEARRGFRVLVGSAKIFIAGMEAGATGGVLGQALFAPELCIAAYQAYLAGRLEMARDLEKRLEILVRDVGTKFGVAGVKAALDLSGYVGGSPRPPLLPLSAGERREVAKALAAARAGLEF